jgi:hypothetical protein
MSIVLWIKIDIYQSRSILVDGDTLFNTLINKSYGSETPLLIKREPKPSFSKELMGKNIALLVMIDYDKRIIVVHRSHKEL